MTVIGVGGIVKPKPSVIGIKGVLSKEKLLAILPAAKNSKDINEILKTKEEHLEQILKDQNDQSRFQLSLALYLTFLFLLIK